MGESTRNAGGRFAKKKKGRGGESAPVMPRREGKMARTRSARVEEKRDGVHVHVDGTKKVHVHPHSKKV